MSSKYRGRHGYRTSKDRSLQARRQRRNPDGTFAKGFKRQVKHKNGYSSKSMRTNSHSKPLHKPPTNKTKNTIGYDANQKPRDPFLYRGYTRAMRLAEKYFNFNCNEHTRRKVLKTVTENFSKEEIEKIDDFGKVSITNAEFRDKNGAYQRMFTW